MKRLLFIAILILGLLGGSIVIYFKYSEGTFVENNFVKYTGIDEYIILTNYHDDFQSYFEALISQSNKRILSDKFLFVGNLEKLKGRVEPNFITENDSFIYYIIEDGYGPYGYILFALEKDGLTLKVYEFYGN